MNPPSDLLNVFSTADAYRSGYFRALKEVLEEARQQIADVGRGVCVLEELVDRLERCDWWPDVPPEWDDDCGDDEDEDERVAALCADCGKDTLGTPEGDWYVVHDHVWKAAGMEPDGFLHRACLERRLGRKLTPADYTNAPVNAKFLRDLVEAGP
jgi:hypothetical protein